MCHDVTEVAPLLVVVRPEGDRTCCPINLSTVQSFIAKLLLMALRILAETRALQHLLLALSTAAMKKIVHMEFRVLLGSYTSGKIILRLLKRTNGRRHLLQFPGAP